MDGKLVDPLRQHILEAVDCLRQRKCRPDREAIAHYVLRKFGSTMNEIFAELENIVDEGGLIKVEYKGTTSYRSPSSFDTKNSPLLTKHSKILNSSKTTRLITSAINELLVKDPNYSKEGVPLTELKEMLIGFDKERFAEDKIDLLIEREVNCGSIFLAKAEVLDNSIRVFPKDIPIPKDMKVVTLGVDPLGGAAMVDKDEKKARKPRKSNANAGASTPGTSGTGRKSNVKAKVKQEVKSEPEDNEGDEDHLDDAELEQGEGVTVFAVKSDPVATHSVSAPKKTPRLNASKKVVPEQVAVAVRKTIEEAIAFETTSACMMKLAAGLVSKTTESEESSKPKFPTLVLADSVNISNSDADTQRIDEPMDTDPQVKVSPTAATNTKKRGVRAYGNSNKTKVESEDEMVKQEEPVVSPESSPNDQGLTRSKRDKRKKKVFDPSDLPNTYSSFSSASKLTRKSRSNSNSSPDEPPAKKPTPAKQPRTSQKKGLTSVTKDQKTTATKSKNGLDKPVAGKGQDIPDDPIPNSDTELPTSEKSKKTCDICSDGSKNVESGDEEFLTCTTCHVNIHASCVEYSPELTKRIHDFKAADGARKILWECIDCKTCLKCNDSLLTKHHSVPEEPEATEVTEGSIDESSGIKFVLCDNCDRGYHLKCIVDSELMSSDSSNWMCQECKGCNTAGVKSEEKGKKKLTKKKKETTTSKKPSVPAKKATTKVVAPQVVQKRKPAATEHTSAKGDEKLINDSTDSLSSGVCEDEDDDDGIDVAAWSLSDVESYFKDKGLKEEAEILKNQEVDGCSLMLLKREDIIHGMGFRLGPALKVNRLVAELQSKAIVKPKWPSDLTSTAESENPSAT